MEQVAHTTLVFSVWGTAYDLLRNLFKQGKYSDDIPLMSVRQRLDAIPAPKIDFTAARPLCEQSWKRDFEAMGGKDGIDAPCFKVQNCLPFLAHVAFNRAKIKQRSELYRQSTERIWNPADLFEGGVM